MPRAWRNAATSTKFEKSRSILKHGIAVFAAEVSITRAWQQTDLATLLQRCYNYAWIALYLTGWSATWFTTRCAQNDINPYSFDLIFYTFGRNGFPGKRYSLTMVRLGLPDGYRSARSNVVEAWCANGSILQRRHSPNMQTGSLA